MRSPTMEACLREQMGRAAEAGMRWKARYERCAARCKAAIVKLRAGFAEAEEAYLNTLTDEVGKREEMIRELHGQLSCLCAAIESHPLEQENAFIKQERERSRNLLEHYDVSEMAKPPLRHWDGCTGRCCKGK